MIPVIKGNEPEELAKLRQCALENHLSPKAAYQTLQNPEKRIVLEALKWDQGQLCVYCMSRIPSEDVDVGINPESIEHFIPLEPTDGRDVGQALDYDNLFAVCHGNMRKHRSGESRKKAKDTLTCDKHRGNLDFRKINPMNPETLKSISYTIDGQIRATDPDVFHDLTEILNLNCPQSPLVQERKAALDELINSISISDETQRLDLCKKLLESFKNEKNPKTPYVGILIWYLEDLIRVIGS